jgi:hypothetical protein
MRKLIVVMLLSACAEFAGADCRVVEYPDRYEAICDGAAGQAPASPQRSAQDQVPGQEQTVASEQTPESEQVDVPIVRNELARLHAAYRQRPKPGQ